MSERLIELGWGSYREIMNTASFYKIEYYPSSNGTMSVIFEPTDAFDLTKLAYIFWYTKPSKIQCWIEE